LIVEKFSVTLNGLRTGGASLKSLKKQKAFL